MKIMKLPKQIFFENPHMYLHRSIINGREEVPQFNCYSLVDRQASAGGDYKINFEINLLDFRNDCLLAASCYLVDCVYELTALQIVGTNC